MAAIDKLTLLKATLNMRGTIPQERTTQLTQLLTIAASRISKYGITLVDSDEGDAMLQVDYAAWMYQRRAQTATTGMPEHLRLAINDRLVHEKAQVDNGA